MPETTKAPGNVLGAFPLCRICYNRTVTEPRVARIGNGGCGCYRAPKWPKCGQRALKQHSVPR